MTPEQMEILRTLSDRYRKSADMAPSFASAAIFTAWSQALAAAIAKIEEPK